ncbi:MAG: hypothetical protein FWD60_04335 [Candidatus Azobacteroides sp.]|nr:hypothetical protein [Candidatus Azobacteroides sp.]
MEDNTKNLEEQQGQNIEPVSKHEIIITDKKSKKGTKILLIIVGVLMLAAIVIGLKLWKDIYDYNQNAKKEYYLVIAEKLNFVQKKSKDGNDKTTFTIVRELPFGTEVEIDFKDIIQQDNKTYYGCTYYLLDGSTAEIFKRKENYYLETTTLDELESTSYRREYLRTFPIKDAQQLSASVKRTIVGYIYDNSIAVQEYFFTQDPNRIKKSIVLADFNMDGEQDAAVILEDAQKRNRLLILCCNKDTKKSYLAYTASDAWSAVINSFKKDAKIFINSEDLVKAPNNGIIYEILEGSKEKFAIFYNPKTMQFEQYIQKPLSEIHSEPDNEPDEPDNE